MKNIWFAGYGEQVITPVPGTALAGYGYNTDRCVERVRDDLKARAVCLRTAGTEVLLVSCDLLNIPTVFAAELRHLIARRCSLAVEQVMVGAIHTHGGPSLRNDAYREAAMPLIVEAAAAAGQNAVPVTQISAAFEVMEPIGFNRRSRDFDGIDPVLRTVFIDRGGEEPIVLWSYACHPVVFGPEKQVTADFPGEVNRRLAERNCHGVFLQGCCGDIDPVSNRNRWGAGTDDDIELLGELIFRRIEKSRHYAAAIPADRLTVRWTELDLPLQIPAETTEIDRELAARLGSSDIAGADDFLRLWAERAKAELPERHRTPFLAKVPFGAIRLGDWALLAIPGEPFAEYALKLSEQFPKLLIWGYANGLAGYLPTAAAYEDYHDYACYQICKAYSHLFPFSPAIESAILAAAEKLLTEEEE